MKKKNNWKDLFIGLFVLLCVFGVIIFLIKQKYEHQKGVITIGIVQTISHPAFEMAKDGLMQELKRLRNVEFIVQNAEGSMLTAQAIAKNFHNNKNITAIVALGTLATQAVHRIEKDKNLFFCAVTDPESAGIKEGRGNVYGVCDMVNVEASVRAIKELIPSAKTVAILSNPAEPNSVSIVNKMNVLLKQAQLEPIHIGVNSEAEVLVATSIATHKADVLLIPTDNTIACVMNTVGTIAKKAKKPLFICDKLLISEGVLCAAGGVDYNECGVLTALMIEQVLVKKQFPQKSIIRPTSHTVIVHKKTAQILGLNISEMIKHNVICKD
jgi:putative tryptophan/tyrosine transport system substrate-binding protein